MSDYDISGIWVSKEKDSEFISHVMLHKVDSTGLRDNGKKASKDEVIELIKNNTDIMTIVWDYSVAGWISGAKVTEEHLNKEYLRTVPDHTVTNNLHNLPRMTFFGI